MPLPLSLSPLSTLYYLFSLISGSIVGFSSFSELEARDYEIVESRGYEDMVDIDARQPEFLEAREYEAEQLLARDFEDEALEARDTGLPAGGQNPMPMNAYPSYPSYNSPVLAAAPAGGPAPGPTPVGLDHAASPAPTPTTMPAGGNMPSQTVTITQTPTPTPCTKKQALRHKQMAKVKEAVAIVRAANAHEGPLTSEQKKEVKAAKKYLKKVRHRRVKAAKRTIKKCKAALKKANLKVKDCKAGADCSSAYLDEDLSPARCKAAFKYMKRVKAAKKAEKKAKHHKGEKHAHKTDAHSSGSHQRSAKPYSDLLSSSKTKSVGPDGITTVIVNAGPTCTATPGSSSKSSRHLVARDEEFEYVSAREYDYDNLD